MAHYGNKRRQFLVDKKTQFKIAFSLTALWFAGGLIVAGFPAFAMFCFGTLIEMRPLADVTKEVVDAMWFPVIMAVIVIPLGVWYSIRFSNRIAGPIFRIHRECRRLLEGEDSYPAHLRDKDFFMDFADTFNKLRDRILTLESMLEQRGISVRPEDQSSENSSDEQNDSAEASVEQESKPAGLPIGDMGGSINSSNSVV